MVFWLLFLTLTLSIALVTTFNFYSHITCSIFSSFMIILPIDYWVGSSLKYIMINIVRRATVEDFNLAIIRPPIQTKGIIFFISCISFKNCCILFYWIFILFKFNYILIIWVIYTESLTDNMLIIKCFETI